MQKLITIYLSSSETKEIQEHLNDYLEDGWKVINMCPAGTYSAGSYAGAGGFLSVLLEKI